MPAAFDACVNNGGRVRTKKMKDGKYIHMCFPKGGGPGVAGYPKKKKEHLTWLTSDLLLEDYKIQETLSDGTIKESMSDDRVKIRGLAIKAGNSRNKMMFTNKPIQYSKEGLLAAAQSLVGTSIALNHSDNAEDNVGTVRRVYPEENGDIFYEGDAYNTGKHPYVIELLRKGLIKHVSIEAEEPVIEETKDAMVVKSLNFIGMAFVRHPGIPDASANIDEAFTKFDTDSSEEEDEDIGENMEEKMETKESNEVSHVLEKLVSKFDETAKLKEEIEALKNDINTLKEAPKAKGNITSESAPNPYPFVKLTETYGKAGTREIGLQSKGTFIVGPGDNTEKKTMEVFAAHPEEFY